MNARSTGRCSRNTRSRTQGRSGARLRYAWSTRSATVCQRVVNSPERCSTQTTIVSELSLQTKSLTVIVANPLPVKDDLLDASVLDEFRLEVLLVNDPGYLALREHTGEVSTLAGV